MSMPTTKTYTETEASAVMAIGMIVGACYALAGVQIAKSYRAALRRRQIDASAKAFADLLEKRADEVGSKVAESLSNNG